MWNSPVVWGVLLVILVLFGGSKIPEMMRGLGQGVKELKKGMKEDEDEELKNDKERERLKAEVRAEIEKELQGKK
jgi:sec-independent protein translocase protein TatA